MGSKDCIRLALVGAGALATRVHYPSLALIEGAKMVALCDLVETKLHEVADRFQIERRYTRFSEMIEKEDVDAVYIIMPPHLLHDLVIASLKAKRHVFVEKPPALTSFQVRSYVREAEKNDVLGMVGFNRRYMPTVNYALNLVQQTGPVTQVVSVFYKRNPAVYYGGVLDALGCDAIHSVDALRYLAGGSGEIAQVHAIADCNGDVIDNAWNAVMKFTNGVTGVLLTNWNVGGRMHCLEIHSPGISAFVDPDTGIRILRENKVETHDAAEICKGEQEYMKSGFYYENLHFIECVKEKRNPRSSFQDAVHTMELVERIRR